jgi:hypothetical protein
LVGEYGVASQVSFTMQTDAHVMPHVQREATAKMDEILNPKPVAIKPDAAKAKLNGKCFRMWWALAGSNRGPSGCKPDALTD